MVSVVYGSTLSRRLKLQRSNIPWLYLFSVFSACPCGVGKSGWRWSLILVSMITSCCNKTKVTNKSRRRVETLTRPSLGDRFKRPLDRGSIRNVETTRVLVLLVLVLLVLLMLLPLKGGQITYSHVFFLTSPSQWHLAM